MNKIIKSKNMFYCNICFQHHQEISLIGRKHKQMIFENKIKEKEKPKKSKLVGWGKLSNYEIWD